MAKKKVFLTGASGSMGGMAFKELLGRRDSYDIRLLLRPSKVNKENFTRYENEPGVEIVWGDLTSPEDVLIAVTGVDVVLHPAAMIAPAADHHPEQARKINVGAARNIVDAIKKQPDNGDNIKLINVGSVAEYGDRRPPYEMIMVGDPLKPCILDYYATTKIDAEKIVVDSGIKYWASIRQCFVAIPNALSLMDPIMFHQPPVQHIELTTSRDCGYALVQCIEAPEDFWRRIYNVGGGPSCRFMYLDFMKHMMGLFHLGDCEKIMDLNWFATQNFHDAWFGDSWALNEYTGHWRDSLGDYYDQVAETVPKMLEIGGRLAPSFAVKMYLKRMADPYKWVKEKNMEYVKPFFGSIDNWEKIGGWDTYKCEESSHKEEKFPLRYKKDEEYTLSDIKVHAEKRGGGLLSDDFYGMDKVHRWQCGFGHEFDATPKLIVMGGHWCPDCNPAPWDFNKLVKVDKMLAEYCFLDQEVVT